METGRLDFMETNTYPVKIKTLTPVHIGSGNDYGPSEYVNSRAKLKGEPVDIIKRIDVARYYTELDENKKDRFLSNLTNPRFKLEDVDKNINKKFTCYNAVNETKKPLEGDVSEHIKTSGKMYIPGSSLKGAIRTAIFYNIVDEDDFSDFAGDIIVNRRGRIQIDKRNYQNWIDGYFSSRGGNAAQKSIMKFFQVADSSTVKLSHIHEIKAIMANENNRSQFYSRNGSVVKSYYETIAKGTELKSNFTIQNDEKILSRLDLLDKTDILDIDFIKKSVYDFSQDLIRYELDFTRKYKISYLEEFYEKLENDPDKPLLRVGAGSGLMATSIAMKVKEYDYNAFDWIRDTFKKAYEFEFPKSRKITQTGLPLSWVQLEF